ncbi:hypothetical protein [Aeromonas simiae]|uniref:hypothetical protein n=1 Tax=Aeromonas simiae TaxID=218936 RepID=UPI00266CE52B|nr:hypothetical protein [Aeromonas simiae]MDO2950546.1 hypothetical protein [Aeromonas simiae]
MKIKLSPINHGVQLAAAVSGDIMTLNGVELDFSPLMEGGHLPVTAIDSPWIASDVERVEGEISLTLYLPHGSHAPRETLFPAAFTEPMTVVDGPVPLPPYDAPPVVDDVQLPEIETEQEVTT